MIHQANPDMLPDSEFVPGTLAHLVVGNRGRLLDPRRTPIRIVDLVPHTGHFVLEIEDFEDKGARWEIPFEGIRRYQFEPGSARAAASDVERYADLIRRLDRPLSLACDPACASRTLQALAELQKEANAWLREYSRYFAAHQQLDLNVRKGPEELCLDLRSFMEARGVQDLEEAFATHYVSNPYSGELVKGHRIVMAELGLVPYDGTIVRDPELFDGPWSKHRRAGHILARLAFMRATFAYAGLAAVTLYRGMSFEGKPAPPHNGTFVSASFDFEVALSCFSPRQASETGLIIRQAVPVERLFMTYLETAQMNRQFAEAEAVLLYETGNSLF